MAGFRILIVDDEPAVVVALELAFEDRDWVVDTAGDVKTALRKVEDGAFDLALVDKNLPDGDGVSLIRDIRRRDSHIKLVMMTGYASVASAVGTANLGIEAYLEKPFADIYDVADEIEELLDREITVTSVRIARALALGRRLSGKPRGPRQPIVVVSVDENTRKGLAALLDEDQFQPTPAANLGGILACISSGAVGVVIDAGPDIVSLLANLRAKSSIPVAVLAAHIDLITARRLISLQVNALLTAADGRDGMARKLEAFLSALLPEEGQ